MKKVINFAKEFSPSIIALVLPVLSFAQTSNTSPALPGSVGGPTSGITSIGGILGLLCIGFLWAFYFLVVLAIIFVIVAAFKYLTAAGDPEKVKSAGATLLYAAIAIGVGLLARALPLVVGSVFSSTGGSLQAC